MKKYIIPLAFILSCLFCFVVYPKISGPYNVLLDSDGWSKLGQGIYQYQTLSYYPKKEPTIKRSPVYPALIASILWITHGKFWPYSLQLFQCLLFALTCFLIYWIAEDIFNKKIAVISSFLCAIYPFLIWYTSRIWVESTSVFLFTCLIASIVYFIQKPTYQRSILVGIILALNILNKQTFLPFIIILPILLYKFKRKAVMIAVISLTLAIPWTYRNWKLTHEIIPVHLLAGHNLQIGDGMLQHYRGNPFSYAFLYKLGIDERVKPLRDKLSALPIANWEKELILDKTLIKDSMDTYKKNPFFFLKKILINSYSFWILGENKPKTIVIGCMQIPILVLFLISAIKIIRIDLLSEKAIPIYLVIIYWFLHLPIAACARYSIPLVPIMLVYAIYGLIAPTT